MANTIKRFDFTVRGGKASKPGTISSAPIINITLKRWAMDQETPVITQDMVNEREIDDQIKLLHEDLDAVAEAAKIAFRKKLAESISN